MTVDQLLKPDPPRDRFGRYLLRLPGDTKARGRTRVTTFIKALDQGDGLIAWKATATMVGALRNPGLHAKWAAIFAQSQDPWYHSDDLKTKCKKLVDECADHGGAQSRADLGTALHAMLELVARGETPNLVDPYKADVEAFKQTLDAVPLVPHPDWTEVCVYIEPYDLVGTFDGFFYGEHGPLILGDYKTETSTDYKALAHAAQLAAYSLATHRIVWPQDPDGEATLEPLPAFDHDTGLIIHLPAGEARCTLHAVDLAQGREALELASSMRRFDAQRKRKDTGGLMRPWTPTPTISAQAEQWERDDDTDPIHQPATHKPNTQGNTQAHTQDGLLGDTCPTVITAKPGPGPDTPQPNEPIPVAGKTADNQPASSPTDTTAPTSSPPTTNSSSPSSETDLKARLRDIHQHQPDLAHLIGRRWPPGVPAIRDPWTESHWWLVWKLLDELDIEGPMLGQADLERIADAMNTLAPAKYSRIEQWVIEAASDPTRYRPLALGAGNHTTRRINLAETCLLIAGNEVSDVSFLNGIHAAYGGPVPPIIGHALGTLNWRQAQHLLTLTRLHINLGATPDL